MITVYEVANVLGFCLTFGPVKLTGQSHAGMLIRAMKYRLSQQAGTYMLRVPIFVQTCTLCVVLPSDDQRMKLCLNVAGRAALLTKVGSVCRRGPLRRHVGSEDGPLVPLPRQRITPRPNGIYSVH